MALISALCGAVTGAIAGGAVGWLIAPTRAEREERGKKRVIARETIASAIVDFQYAISEARQQLYRKNIVNRDDFEGVAVRFAGTISRASAPLPRMERWRLRRHLRNIVGPGIIRIVELRPAPKYEAGADSARLRAIADTRPWVAEAAYRSDLLDLRPTDSAWDILLARLQRMQKAYP